MATKEDHAAALARALPPGEAWPDNTDGTWELDNLLLALSGEAARGDTDAEAFLENFFPDTCVDFLADWERILSLSRGALTTSERQQQILAKLRARGIVTRADLESVLQTRRNDPNLQVLQGLHNMFIAGQGCGTPVNSAIGNAAWVCEYMPNLIAEPDAFEFWLNTNCTVTDADFGSPITLAQTADKVVISGVNLLRRSIASADDQTIFAGVWLRAVDDSAPQVALSIMGRDGVSRGETFTLSKAWCRVTIQETVGTGATQAYVALAGASVFNYHASYAVAGVVDADFEEYARGLPHLHTIGFFDVIGANG